MAIITLCLSLYTFFLSIDLLSTAFKLFGKGFADAIITGTSNPFVGLGAGIFATSVVQSSSCTTSIVVGMVASGALFIRSAIPIVMGANIGTTVTNTLVSVGHISRSDEFKRALAGATIHDFFNIFSVCALLPIELIFHPIEKLATVLAHAEYASGSFKVINPLKLIVSPATHFTVGLLGGHSLLVLVVAIALLFLSLKYITSSMKGIALVRVERFLDSLLFKNFLTSFLFGLCLTALVQSSSVTTSLAIPLIAARLLSLEKAFPYMLGANVGTTVTAILASLITQDVNAVTIAFAHLIFNVFGILLIYPFGPIRRLPLRAAKYLAVSATERKIVVLFYILLTFYVVPLIVIISWR